MKLRRVKLQRVNEMEAILDGPAHSEILMLLVETAFLPRHEPPQIRGKLGDAIYESMKQCMKKSRGSGFKWLAMRWEGGPIHPSNMATAC